MSTAIQVFTSQQFGQVRTVEIYDEPWFVLSDICAALAIANTTQAAGRLDQDEKSMFNIGLSGGATNCVNEYGLYNLILASRKPEAKQFKRWITHEVIPAIRQHGGYLTPEKIEEVLLDPDTIISMATALKAANAEKAKLQIQNSQLLVGNEIMRPKAEYFDELVDRNLLTSFRDTAKSLGVPERVFVKFLIDNKYVYRNKANKLMPYAEKNDGLFELKECFNEKTNWKGHQTLITPKGRETFRLICQGLEDMS